MTVMSHGAVNLERHHRVWAERHPGEVATARRKWCRPYCHMTTAGRTAVDCATAGSVARSERHSGADCRRRERNRTGRAQRVVALPRWLKGLALFHARQAGGAAQNGAATSRSTSDSWSAVRSSVRSKLCERRSTAVDRGHSVTAEIAACGQQRSTAVTPDTPGSQLRIRGLRSTRPRRSSRFGDDDRPSAESIRSLAICSSPSSAPT